MLDDYGAAIQSGMNAVPNPLEGQLNLAKVGLAQTAAQGAQIQNAAAIQSLRLQQIELQRRAQFGQDMQGFVQSPTAEGLASLVGRYPEFASEAQNAWGTLDTAERRATATQLGSVAALVAKGDYDDAASMVQSRIDADTKAGRDTSAAQQMLQMLKSGDPTQRKAVIGLASVYAGGAVGFDKAADFLKGLGLSQEAVKTGPGESLINPLTGEHIASVAPNLAPVTVTNTDGSQTATAFNPQSGAFGAAAANGAPAVPAGAAAATGTPGAQTQPTAGGFQPAVARVLQNEGGFNPKDMNGSPTMMGINYKANAKTLRAMGITPQNFKNMTPDQATQIYQGYWSKSGAQTLPANLQTPYFDVYVRNPKLAKTALAQSGGDPAKFMQIASSYFQKLGQTPKGQQYAQAWENRDAINTQLANGAAPAGGPAAAPVAQANPYTFGGSNGSVNTKGADPGYAWNASHTAEVPTGGGPEDFSPAALDTATDQYILTGQLPGGMGGGGIKSAILKNAPIRMAALGFKTADLPGLRGQFKSLSGALTQATQTSSALRAAQMGLQHDSQLLQGAQKPLVDMGIIQDGGLLSNFRNRKMLAFYEKNGSPAQQAAVKTYLDAVNGFARTYGKFMSAANGSGGSAAPSDASQAMADELNDEGMGPTTLNMHLRAVTKEADNKRRGWESQAANLQAKLHGLLPGAQQQSLPQGAKVVGTYRGHTVIEVNGQRLVEQ